MRTYYQVGNRGLFEGQMLRGLTEMPIRRIDFAKASFAGAVDELDDDSVDRSDGMTSYWK